MMIGNSVLRRVRKDLVRRGLLTARDGKIEMVVLCCSHLVLELTMATRAGEEVVATL